MHRKYIKSVVSSDHFLSQEERKRGNSKRLQHREEHLAKILTLARAKKFITNDAIEKLLHVSDATASRYLRLLVQRGQLLKEGNGRGVKYRIV